MASWQDVAEHLGRQYTLARQTDESVALVFDTHRGRSQVVFVVHHVLNAEDWIEVSSPIGKLSDVDLLEASRAAGRLVCGGLQVEEIDGDDVVQLCNAIPIANLDENELEGILHTVTISADQLEEALTGRDDM